MSGAGPAPGDSPGTTVRQLSVTRAGVVIIVALCGLCEACALVVYALHFTRGPWQDWMVYYAAARGCLDGNLRLVLDAPRFTAALNNTFAAWLPEPFSYRSWSYPPIFLLLLLPFGLLSFVASCVLFQVTTLGGMLAGIRAFVGRRRWALVTGIAVLSPPAAFNIGSGQNGFLTSALLVGAFGLIDEYPAAAGMLLGVLSYKPQFWPLAMLALIASRQWRALAAAIAAAGALALASVALLGLSPWQQWIAWAVRPPPDQLQSFLKCCLLHDESIYTNVVIFGASSRLADVAQAAALAIGAASVWWCYRNRTISRDLQLAALLAATALAAPHFANYDAVLLVMAVALLFVDGLDRGFRRGGMIVPALVYVMQLFNPPDVFRAGAVTPLLTIALIACIVERARVAMRAEMSTATPFRTESEEGIGAPCEHRQQVAS